MQAKDFLPDDVNQGEMNGVVVRKGTVGAFLLNARVWMDPATPPAERAIAECDMIEVIPALRALGLFDVFAIRDSALEKFIGEQ